MTADNDIVVAMLEAIKADPSTREASGDLGRLSTCYEVAKQVAAAADGAVRLPPSSVLAELAGRSRQQVEQDIEFLLARRFLLRGKNGFRLAIQNRSRATTTEKTAPTMPTTRTTTDVLAWLAQVVSDRRVDDRSIRAAVVIITQYLDPATGKASVVIDDLAEQYLGLTPWHTEVALAGLIERDHLRHLPGINGSPDVFWLRLKGQGK